MHDVFVDTNIFVRVITQGRPGCDLKAYEKLKTLVSGDTIRLLVPEVVTLELERHQLTLLHDFEASFGKLKKHVAAFDYWSEIADLKELLHEKIDKAKDDKIQRARKMLGEMLEFLRSDKTVLLPLTPDIVCRARKRLISGKMPRAEKKTDQDAMIIESLVSYFEGSSLTKKRLLFCSSNHRDFAKENKAKGKDRSFEFSPLLVDNLPRVDFYTDLDSLLSFDHGYEETYTQTSDAELVDIDEEEPDWEAIDRESHDEIEAHFLSQVLPNIPEVIREQRKQLITSINNLMKACRGCSTWDNRSEEKLSQWIEFVPEYAIPFTSTSNLVIIQDNLRRYLQIHQEDENSTEQH